MDLTGGGSEGVLNVSEATPKSVIFIIYMNINIIQNNDLITSVRTIWELSHHL